jgi:Protein tyrosine and serine/threonine kinase
VWAFAITSWEVFNAGEDPYPGQKALESARKVFKGYRMEYPSKVPDGVRRLMQQCTLDDPKARPTFSEIVDSLDQCEDGEEIVYASLTTFVNVGSLRLDAEAKVESSGYLSVSSVRDPDASPDMRASVTDWN